MKDVVWPLLKVQFLRYTVNINHWLRLKKTKNKDEATDRIWFVQANKKNKT